MNMLKQDKKEMILSSLVEGNSIRSIERITGVHRDTIMRLLISTGSKAEEVLDNEIMGLECKRVQVDEIWTYVGMKQRTLIKKNMRHNINLGDQYVFVALDADTKLVTNYTIGKRSYDNTYSFIHNLSKRIKTRFQLSSDSWGAYLYVVESVFLKKLDYGQIHKQYGQETGGEKRYSPAKIIDVTIRLLLGNPDIKHISTSYVERQNLTMRMQMRRFTRLTNAFSKKLENLKAAVALHFYYYNFMRIHQSLRVTPAMEAKTTDHIWNWSDLLGYSGIKVAA